MRYWLLYLFLCSVSSLIGPYALASGRSATPRAPQVIIERAAPKVPLTFKQCVRYRGNGDCREYDYTYFSQGVSCVENCVVFDSFEQCKVRNRCVYDDASGCFVRRRCVELDRFSTCREWVNEVACD
jgi:hypothetical protein